MHILRWGVDAYLVVGLEAYLEGACISYDGGDAYLWVEVDAYLERGCISCGRGKCIS